MAWQTPVFDRTETDVAEHKDSCYINADLLNRIEGNVRHIAQILGVQLTAKTNWTEYDFLTPGQMQRILGNIRMLQEAYYEKPGSPELPVPPVTALNWNDINSIESNIWGVLDLWQQNQSNKIPAGERFAGEEIGVI